MAARIHDLFHKAPDPSYIRAKWNADRQAAGCDNRTDSGRGLSARTGTNKGPHADVESSLANLLFQYLQGGRRALPVWGELRVIAAISIPTRLVVIFVTRALPANLQLALRPGANP